MASSQGYLEFILEQLSDAGDVAWRAMMREWRKRCTRGCPRPLSGDPDLPERPRRCRPVR